MIKKDQSKIITKRIIEIKVSDLVCNGDAEMVEKWIISVPVIPTSLCNTGYPLISNEQRISDEFNTMRYDL